MKFKPPPDISRLREFYYYNPDTGKFSHKMKTHLSKIGRVAGNNNGQGYTRVRLDGKWYLAHRLAWYYIYEKWPGQIDHKNRIKDDNRIENLREANQIQQQGNRHGKKKSGLPRGVFNHRGRYQATICINGKVISLGCFNSIDKAKEAYERVAKKHFGEYLYLGPQYEGHKK